MSSSIVNYQMSNRETAIQQVLEDGKEIIEYVAIDLDLDGQPTNCYFVVNDAPLVKDPTYEELLKAYIIATGGVPT